jgi:aminopeptidase N
VAGNLAVREQRIRTRSGRDHLLQIYVRPGDLGKTEHAMASLVASVAWDEARFGLALDLDRYMIVAVEDYNGGAMENKGLNLFNTKYVLASPPPPPTPTLRPSKASSRTSTSTTGPATASPAATGSSCR